MTANELQRHQTLHYPSGQVPAVVQLGLLREQDFGSLELVPWSSRRTQDSLNPSVPGPTDPSFRPQETAVAMSDRAEAFLADFILPLFAAADDTSSPTQECVAVVSHGLFLSVLWQTLLRKFNAGRVVLGPNIEVPSYSRPLEYLPSWTNTGFLELTIENPIDDVAAVTSKPAIEDQVLSPFSGFSMTIHSVNSKDHLIDLKRARGGLGSLAYDAKQQSLDGFFRRPK
ncbi:hypothetical protein A1O7_10111 [Cladophialophora yegresii CBS 114405]|uniref:Phosphoglycerate mutase n=1 Tax=Cladophialophora yegresii CBS 114405 TaxID=1182544 RepID=W9VP23_9EURO|nr:uncharacterized protein A1O7_10111 [Cladophialophora yegresii CBS 114405]EXJ54770.1 hypothetical protein A1O7_10111 [Cladophialophora yegresii CBS 114405]